MPVYALEKHENLLVQVSGKYPNLFNSLRDYHDLKNCILSVGGITKDNLLNTQNDKEEERKYALLYGGGKDSLLSAGLHHEIYGEGKTVLLRLLFATDVKKLKNKGLLFKKAVKNILDIGFDLKTCQSDFHTNIRDSEASKRSSFALYIGFFAPLLKKYDFKQLSLGVDATEYHQNNTTGKLPYLRVRPEKLIQIIDAFNSSAETSITLKNFNFSIPPGLAFNIILRRYPEFLSSLYMCERDSAKWCIKCRKCFTYVLYSIAYKNESREFNFSYYFENSTYIKALIDDIKNLKDINKSGMPPYVEKLCYHKHQLATYDIINKIDFLYARNILSLAKYPNAWKNFLFIISPFLGLDSKENNHFWLSAYDYESKTSRNDTEKLIRKKLISIVKSAKGEITTSKLIEGRYKKGTTKYTF